MEKFRHITQQTYKAKKSSFIEKQFSQYISKNEHIAVAVSWWPDSMFLSFELYNFFVQKKYNLKNITFVHLNHNVRSESILELRNIKQRFKWTQILTFTRKKTKKATENDLRKRRYKTFLDIMKKQNINKIFLGHHFDDRVETSILNLIRWCWEDGFMSIKQLEFHYLLQWKTVVRPLINIRKSQILKLCETQKIPYVQDITNQDSSISQRNFLRNEILPNLFSQKWFEQLFKKRYKKYDSQSLENLLQPITKNPKRKTKSAYCLSKRREELTSQDLLRIFKQLHASSGVTRDTLKDFIWFIKTGSKWWKYIQWVVIMISHNKVYFFVAKPLFWQKPLDKVSKIDTYYYKWKTWNKYCIAQKIPVFWRNFIPVKIQWNKILSRDKKRRKSIIY